MNIKDKSTQLACTFVKSAGINYKALLGEMAGGGATGALMGGLLGGTINTARGLINRSYIPDVMAATKGEKSKLKVGLSILHDKLFGPKVTAADRLKAMARDFGNGALAGSGIGGVAGAAYGPIPHVTKAINSVLPLDKLQGKELRIAQAIADKVGYKGLSFLDGVGNGIYNVGSPVLRAAIGTAPDFISNANDFVKIFI